MELYHVDFSCTNENLNSIMAGMIPEESDRILALAGSGDQAFALLERAGKVIAVDRDRSQVRFVRERADALQIGDYRKFLQIPPYSNVGRLDVWSRNIYFKGLFGRTNRLERIRKRLSRFEIAEGDIFQAARNRGMEFNKVYMSNVREWPMLDERHHSFLEILEYLPDDCLIYTARPAYLNEIGLVRDEKLTLRARRFDLHWEPTVYRTVRPPEIPYVPALPVIH